MTLLDTTMRTIDASLVSADQLGRLLRQAGLHALGPALAILLIVGITFVLLRGLRSVVRGSMRRLLARSNEPPRELALRVNTLSAVVESAGRLVILIVAAMMVLSKLSLNIGPLLASAGVVGIAIGLGAQSLIRDIIGGFFILFEDQFGVGDVITVSNYTGTVELFSLRRTGLRAVDGSFITVPNGEMRTVRNQTKDWARAVLDVDISYEDDVDRALALLREVVTEIDRDEQIGDAVLGPGEVLGVQALGPYQVTLRLLVKTQPLQQWRVERELRRRIKAAFQGAGITIPYPQSVTVVRTEGAADGLPQAPREAP